MISVDDIDKRIILELDSDCRMTYKTMADKLGLSANAIRKRITKLIDTGVIDRYLTTLSFDMIDADAILAIIHTDGSEFQEEFIADVGKNPAVLQVSSIACGKGGMYFVFAIARGSLALSDIGTFLRTLESVIDVEIHVLIYPRGEKVNLTKMQLRILKHLVDNPRMSIVDIAEAVGMTARRIRRAIGELQEGRGINFSIFWNLGKGGLNEVHLRIEWDEKNTTLQDVIDWLRTEYPLEFWTPFISATAPIIFARFVVDDLEKIEMIARAVKRSPFVKTLSTLVFYSNNLFPWPGVTELRRLIENSI